MVLSDPKLEPSLSSMNSPRPGQAQDARWPRCENLDADNTESCGDTTDYQQ